MLQVVYGTYTYVVCCGKEKDTCIEGDEERANKSGGGMYGGFPCPLPALLSFRGQLPVTWLWNATDLWHKHNCSSYPHKYTQSDIDTHTNMLALSHTYTYAQAYTLTHTHTNSVDRKLATRISYIHSHTRLRSTWWSLHVDSYASQT